MGRLQPNHTFSEVGEITTETQTTAQSLPFGSETEKSLGAVRVETLLLIGLAILAAGTRLWGLGWRVMSHDESLHVYYSWRLATGNGFAHDPMMHGPFLFESTALMDLIFGANDFVSRLVPALLGIFLVIGVPLLLKPWLGKRGAIFVSVGFLVSPFLLFYTRYIRHDPIVVVWLLILVFGILAYLDKRQDRYLYLTSIALALMFSTMEITFIYLAIIVAFFLVRLFAVHRFCFQEIRGAAEFDLLLVLITLGAFFSSPVALLVLNPIWTRLTGSPFVALTLLADSKTDWAGSGDGLRLAIVMGVFWLASIGIGVWWDWKRWAKLAGVFLAINILLFTTFFTNLSGLATGFVGSLGYWLSQQSVARGGQPWYYFLVVLPLYEYLPLLGGILGTIYYLVRRKQLSDRERLVLPFLVWWGIGIFVGLSLAGEKMPWHVIHLVVPMILVTGWLLGKLTNRSAVFSHRLLQATLLATFGILALMTVRTAFLANYVNYDYTTEFIDYAHGAPGVKWVLDDIQTVGQKIGAGADIKVAYDSDVSWPLSWYMRIFPKSVFYGNQPNRDALDAPVVIAGPNDWDKVDRLIGQGYTRYDVIRMWWPMEDYKNLTFARIWNAVTDPKMRAALLDIFWSRDYTAYAALTGQKMDPPLDWPLEDKMRVYIRKDISAELPNLKIAMYKIPDLPKVEDTYLPVRRELTSLQIVIPDGDASGPRNLAVAPDGTIFVADTANSRILKLDKQGQPLTSWGSKSASEDHPDPGTFNEPWGIALDPQGNVYVADTWNHRIQKFDPSGKLLQNWGVAGVSSDGLDRLWGPRGIAIAKDGNIYVTDTGNKRVVVFDPTGKALFEFTRDGEAALDEPVGIAIGADQRVYVADTWNMRVAVFTLDGKLKKSWPVQGWKSNSLDNKPYLAIDSLNRVYVTDPEGSRVIVFYEDGTPLAEFGQYGTDQNAMDLPTGLMLGLDDQLWIADSGNHRLVEYPRISP